MVKNLPTMQKTWVWFLDWEDPLEKGKATHSSYSGLENSMDCIVQGVAKSRTWLNNFHWLTCKELLSSVQSLSHVRLFATPWTAARQASLSITNSPSSLKLMSIESVMPSSHLILCHPLLLLPSIFPIIRVFSNESALRIRCEVSASKSVLPVNTQDWSPLGWTGWISLQPRDSQEASLTPQFKSINSSVLSFLHSPTLTSIHDHWENRSLD